MLHRCTSVHLIHDLEGWRGERGGKRERGRDTRSVLGGEA